MRRTSTLNTMPGLLAFVGMCCALVYLLVSVAGMA